jgi:Flp pilus assembly protein CpaB
MANMTEMMDRLESFSDERTGGGPASQRSRRKQRAGLVAGRGAVLPGSRAIIGALLCTLAALITFGAYVRANRPPTTKYLVATKNLEPGAAITTSDVAAVAMELPDSLSRRALGPSVSLEDAVVLGPVAKGELFQVGNLIKKAGGSESRELSFPIDSAFAAAGRLRPGDRIDVFANHGDVATPIATDLLIIATSALPEGVSNTRGTIVITVAYDGSFDGAELLGAAQTLKLSLIRRTGITGNIRPGRASPKTSPSRAVDSTAVDSTAVDSTAVDSPEQPEAPPTSIQSGTTP